MKLVNKLLLASFATTMLFSACSQKSGTTGWKYNDSKWGGFEKHKFKDQETGPGLVFIEGGTFVMGASEQDVTYDRNNTKRRMSVNSFYMDETEVTNFQYLEYVYWLTRAYGAENPIIATSALPDTLVWRSKLSYNEPYVNYYLRYPAYRDYPVVGVSWLQASEFCKWRSDRVNEYIMIREGLMKNSNINKQNDETFNTEAYMLGLTPIDIKKQLKDYTPGGKKRDVKMEDGILLPIYRLPTEAEWEFASVSYRTASYNENVDSRKIYPWAGSTLRRGDTEKTRGRMYANYVRGRGDYKGIAGNLNDNASYTSSVKDAFYIPNDFGLYHMAGNVSEWVMDVYRPLSLEDNSDNMSFRGNNYKTQERDADGNITEKDSLGRIKYREVSEAENIKRRNYKKADNIGYTDELKYEGDIDQKYEYGITSLIDNAARVYKGGSWNDRAYWLSPGNRRFLDQEQATSTIGFRCVMDRLGSQTKKGRK